MLILAALNVRAAFLPEAIIMKISNYRTMLELADLQINLTKVFKTVKAKIREL